jgi:hypothetical protein
MLFCQQIGKQETQNVVLSVKKVGADKSETNERPKTAKGFR